MMYILFLSLSTDGGRERGQRSRPLLLFWCRWVCMCSGIRVMSAYSNLHTDTSIRVTARLLGRVIICKFVLRVCCGGSCGLKEEGVEGMGLEFWVNTGGLSADSEGGRSHCRYNACPTFVVDARFCEAARATAIAGCWALKWICSGTRCWYCVCL